MSTPVTIEDGIEELRQRVVAGHYNYAIALGAGISRKTIHYKTQRWEITNHIDGSKQRLSDEELWTESHIGVALDNKRLGDLSGNDDLLRLKDEGWVLATPILAASQAADRAAYDAEAAANAADPLRFRLTMAPGSVRIDSDEDADWEPADPSLLIEPMEMGPGTVAQIDLGAVSYGFRDDRKPAATTSTELTIEDIDGIVATLLAIKQDAIGRRGFAIRADGLWTDGSESD